MCMIVEAQFGLDVGGIGMFVTGSYFLRLSKYIWMSQTSCVVKSTSNEIILIILWRILLI